MLAGFAWKFWRVLIRCSTGLTGVWLVHKVPVPSFVGMRRARFGRCWGWSFWIYGVSLF